MCEPRFGEEPEWGSELGDKTVTGGIVWTNMGKPKSNLNRLRDVIDKIPTERRQEADSFFIGYIASDIPEPALVDALDALKQRFWI